MRTLLAITTVSLALAAPAFAQAPADGAAVFQKACASCHQQPAPDSRAPARGAGHDRARGDSHSAHERQYVPQGSELTDAERRAVAGFAAGRPLGTAPPLATVGRCTSKPAALSAAAIASGWNGWGGGVTNTRYQTADKGGLSAAMVPRLKLKWAFGFAGVSSARSSRQSPGDSCSWGARTEPCSRSTRRPGARTGCIRRSTASGPRWPSAPTKALPGPATRSTSRRQRVCLCRRRDNRS